MQVCNLDSLGGVSRNGPASSGSRRRPHGGYDVPHHVGVLVLLLLDQILVAAPQSAGLGERQLGDGAAAGGGRISAAVLEQEAATGKQEGNVTHCMETCGDSSCVNMVRLVENIRISLGP